MNRVSDRLSATLLSVRMVQSSQIISGLQQRCLLPSTVAIKVVTYTLLSSLLYVGRARRCKCTALLPGSLTIGRPLWFSSDDHDLAKDYARAELDLGGDEWIV